MNQRIQQLALEAEVFAKQNNGDFHYFYTRKLSELIVLECVDIIEKLPPGYKDYRDQIEDAFRIASVVQIKQRFGVK